MILVHEIKIQLPWRHFWLKGLVNKWIVHIRYNWLLRVKPHEFSLTSFPSQWKLEHLYSYTWQFSVGFVRFWKAGMLAFRQVQPVKHRSSERAARKTGWCVQTGKSDKRGRQGKLARLYEAFLYNFMYSFPPNFRVLFLPVLFCSASVSQRQSVGLGIEGSRVRNSLVPSCFSLRQGN